MNPAWKITCPVKFVEAGQDWDARTQKWLECAAEHGFDVKVVGEPVEGWRGPLVEFEGRRYKLVASAVADGHQTVRAYVLDAGDV